MKLPYHPARTCLVIMSVSEKFLELQVAIDAPCSTFSWPLTLTHHIKSCFSTKDQQHTMPFLEADADVEADASLIHHDQSGQSKTQSSFLLILKRIILAILIIAASTIVLFLLCVYLPLKYLPEAHKLVGIKQVKDSAIELRPVTSSEVRAWGIVGGEIDDKMSVEEAKEIDNSELGYSNYLQNFFLTGSRFSVQSAFNMASSTFKDRHILIGDIHGQLKELRALLKKLKYNKKRDHLMVLGDFISKGPDSLGVVDELIDAGANCIMGNHEYYVLQYYAKYHSLEEPHFVNGKSEKKNHNVFTGGVQDDPEFILARKLKPSHAEYINSCPVMYKIGKVPIHSKKTSGSYVTGQGVAVHAGLRWDLTNDLNEQNPLECLQMRSYIGPHYNETTDDPSDENAVSWSKIWNIKHEDKEVKDKYVVYYGHDARRGIKLKPWSKGLDNGCVKGDHLAAMVIWKEKTAKGPLYRDQIVRVPCSEA